MRERTPVEESRRVGASWVTLRLDGRALVGLALLATVAVVLLGPSTPALGQASRVVEAEEIVLKGKGGAVRAKIATDSAGNATLELFGQSTARSALALAVDESGKATVSMRDKNGGEVVRISPAESGGADLLLISPEKQQGIFLSFKRGYPCLFLIGDKGKTRIAMTVRSDDDAAIELRDCEESSRIILAAKSAQDCKVLALAKEAMFEFPDASGKADPGK